MSGVHLFPSRSTADWNFGQIRVEYHLTEKGRALGRVIGGLERWADEWIR